MYFTSTRMEETSQTPDPGSSHHSDMPYWLCSWKSPMSRQALGIPVAVLPGTPTAHIGGSSPGFCSQLQLSLSCAPWEAAMKIQKHVIPKPFLWETAPPPGAWLSPFAFCSIPSWLLWALGAMNRWIRDLSPSLYLLLCFWNKYDDLTKEWSHCCLGHDLNSEDITWLCIILWLLYVLCLSLVDSRAHH